MIQSSRPWQRRIRFLAVACAAFWLAAVPGRAQWLGQDYAVYGAPMSNYIASSFQNQTYMNQPGL